MKKFKIIDLSKESNQKTVRTYNIDFRGLDDSVTINQIKMIDSITKTDYAISATLTTGRTITVKYDGTSESNIFRTGNLSVISIKGRNISLERFVMICNDIVNKTIPQCCYKQSLVCNVKDNSSSLEFIRKHNMVTNLRPDNLEWCSNEQNKKHYSILKEILHITGHLYRISAHDKYLAELFSMRSTFSKQDFKEKLLNFLDNNNCERVK